MQYRKSISLNLTLPYPTPQIIITITTLSMNITGLESLVRKRKYRQKTKQPSGNENHLLHFVVM